MTKTIQLISDIHLECHEQGDRGPILSKIIDGGQGVDALVIAGDLCNEPLIYDTLSTLCDHYKDVLYVPGNHECYGSTLAEVSRTQRACSHDMTNLHTVSGDSVRRVVLDGQGYTMCTLWSPGDLTKPISDNRAICDYHSWVPGQYEKNRETLLEVLQEGDVLVTHHIPSPEGIDDLYKYMDNSYFMGDIEDIILDKKPAVALHGHTHIPMSYKVGDTTVYCNPKGYPRECSDGYNYSYLVEV